MVGFSSEDRHDWERQREELLRELERLRERDGERTREMERERERNENMQHRMLREIEHLSSRRWSGDANVELTVKQLGSITVAVTVFVTSAVALFFHKVAQKDDLASFVTQDQQKAAVAQINGKLDTFDVKLKPVEKISDDVKEIKATLTTLSTQVQVLAATRRAPPP